MKLSQRRADDKRDRGAVSVEAALFLSLFFVFFLCMINIMNLVISQTIIQYAINQTAKEISQYAYIMAKMKLEDNFQKNATGSARMNGNINGVIDSFTGLYGAVENLSSNYLDPDAYVNVGQKAGNAVDTTEDFVDYLYEYGQQDALATIKDFGQQKITAGASWLFVESCVKKHLRMLIPGGDADGFLKSLGVVDGISGLSTWNSEFYSGGSKDMELVVTYKIDYKVPFLDTEPVQITLRAATGLW